METVPHHVVIISTIYPLCTQVFVQNLFTLSLLIFRWLRKDGPKAFVKLPPASQPLINALESLGVTERPRYYSREYEHHGTLRCRVILVIARSHRYPNIQPSR